ncbi:uncharacterized protein LOC143280672 [Babylonia areolata]|uniref:uncharacterized protein LOC143280672 n=1 Tax=Babylonia areolata TaxID=304850 RepID=UPI003FD6B14C
MIVLRPVPSAFLLLTAILLSHTGLTVARTLGLGSEDDFADVLSKRNSWWSKKSVDASSDFPSIDPDSEIDASDDGDGSSGAYIKLYGCYTSSCVPDFIGCATRSRTTATFEMCKLGHRACALHCWDYSTNEESAMK